MRISVEKVKRFILRAATVIVCVAAAVICAAIFIGCSKKPSINFSADSLKLYVGDVRDLYPYAVFDPIATPDKTFTLVSDSDCVEVSGTAVTAKKPGVATVTAKAAGGECELYITVEYRESGNLNLLCDGDIVQNVAVGDGPSPLVFAAVLDDFSDPAALIDWQINGVGAGTGITHTLTPDYGCYTVTARAQGLSATKTVLIYRPTSAHGTAQGELQQYKNFSEVRFTATEDIDTRNPRSLYEWRVNGEYAGSLSAFELAPTGKGEYNVELFVNGIKRQIDGKDSVTITANGDRAPDCVVKFDDVGGVFAVWNDMTAARSVAIKTPSGERTVYNRSDARYAHRFLPGSFDATDIIEVCSAAPGAYEVTVTGDAAGEPFVFMQYPLEARQYLTESVVCGNSFISDTDEIREWVRELYARGKTSAAAYICRELQSRSGALTVAATEAAELLGLTATVLQSGQFISIEFETYDNTPKEWERPTVRQVPIAPHAELFGSSNLRGSAYKLSIERAKRSVNVDNSEQLLIAVQNGVRPAPASSSGAESVYNTARAMLMRIIGADYTDEQKVHAIYDWLQFCSRKSTNTVPALASDFLEGVFVSDGQSVVTALGAAKTVALLCGIEGITCTIQRRADGSFYNTVLLDGVFYNVDAFGGESEINGHECMSHGGLFYVNGTDIGSDGSRYYFYDKAVFDGVWFDRFIDISEVSDAEDGIAAAIYNDFDAQADGSFKLYTPAGLTDTLREGLFAEIAVDDRMSNDDRTTVAAYLSEAAKQYCNSVYGKTPAADDIKMFTDGDLIMISVSAR